MRLFGQIFSDMTTSYKIYWFKGIFDEILEGKKEISFKEVACRMVSQAWYPLNIYYINLGVEDKLYEITDKIKKRLGISNNITQKDLYNLLLLNTDSEVNKSYNKLYRYAPHRLLTPFFKAELDKLKVKNKEYLKDKLLKEFLLKDNNSIYKLDYKNQIININSQWYDYIIENQRIIKGWVDYNLVQYLQKCNPNVPAIIDKLVPPNKRNLSNEKKYWKKVIEGTCINDIYTGKELTASNFDNYGALSIDHFIPWSFVGHDKLWNLIPTFSKVNSSKSDSIPKLEEYLDIFCEIQYIGINYMKDKCSSKLLEDYIDINRTINIKEICEVKSEINREKFIKDLKSTIIPLYEIAYNQGFSEWKYN